QNIFLVYFNSIFFFVCVSFLFSTQNLSKIIAFAIIGISFAYIFTKSNERKYKEKLETEITFFLPIAMERIVMAVQAGLDIIPALKRVSEIDVELIRIDNRNKLSLDPVAKFLNFIVKLTDSGLSFEEALNIVVKKVDNSALRHAFIHLGIAQREGGELVMPLKELSDSTQLYFQESIEEIVAKLPVKATMPLLCTFAGLILCFITAPLLQIIEVTSKASIPGF
ncbi:MAG: type II secretion system F family protein, partial [Bdellovibrionales bacterium]|nr:type II secretion system F family protein [Bdellovibrionales bacterium]